MALRKSPTTVNFGPSITGDNYTVKVNDEISALWDRTFQMLDSVSGTNTILATTTPTLLGYAKNQGWGLIPLVTNTGPTQINIDGQGLRNIKDAGGAALVGGELVAGILTPLFDTGTEIRMVPTVIATVNSPISIFALTKASGTGGGSAVTGSRQTYPLSDIVLNEIVGASLIGAGPDQFKINLPIGTFEVDADAQFFACNACGLFLFDQTAGADLGGVSGANGYANNPGKAHLAGKFTLTVPSIVILQYRVQSTRTSDGLGVGTLGETQRYGYVKFKKVA